MTCVVVLAVLAIAGTAPPGQAKGPTDVEASGPGIDDVHLSWTERTDDVDAGTLGNASQLHHMWSPALLGPAPDLSADELGPLYVLRWTTGAHGGEDGPDIVVQHAYPFAEGGAWVEFPTEQEMYDAPIGAGWIQAPRLRRELVALGAVADATQPGRAEPASSVTTSDASGRSPTDQDDGWSSSGVAVPAGVLLAVAVVAGVIVARRRRLSR